MKKLFTFKYLASFIMLSVILSITNKLAAQLSLSIRATGITGSAIGVYNTIYGINAYNPASQGRFNTGIGYSALNSNTTGSTNTAIGFSTLYANTIGMGNTASGYSALYANVSGNNNTANGFSALYYNISGSSNTANGVNALYYNTTGSNNIAIGSNALCSNTTGGANIANGSYALYSNTIGNNNNASGYSALSFNTTGNNNTASGGYALYRNRTGNDNTASGQNALYSNIEGSENVAIGANSLRNNNNSANTAIGFNSLINNSSGFENTGMGYLVMQSNTTGQGNTSIGSQSFENNATGSDNIAYGYRSGIGNVSGSGNTYLGAATRTTVSNINNATAIGLAASVNASNKVRIGNTNVTVIEGQTSFTTSDARFKTNVSNKVKGIDLIMKLKPVTYNFEYSKFSKFLEESNVDTYQLKQRESKIEMGFLAQDVEKTLKELDFNVANMVHSPETEKDNYSIAYGQLVVPLVKAVQEQQGIIEQQKSEIENLQNQINEIKTLLGKGTSSSKKQEGFKLEQNNPNPFSDRTRIAYELPSNINNAQIIITDLSGKQVKTISLNDCCGEVEVSAQDLSNGTYIFSLVANGEILKSNKMVVSKN